MQSICQPAHLAQAGAARLVVQGHGEDGGARHLEPHRPLHAAQAHQGAALRGGLRQLRCALERRNTKCSAPDPLLSTCS